MKGDVIYCECCKSVYREYDEFHDTRTEPKYLIQCPHCLSCLHQVNLIVAVAKLRQLERANRIADNYSDEIRKLREYEKIFKEYSNALHSGVGV